MKYLAECTDRYAGKGQWLVCVADNKEDAMADLNKQEKALSVESYNPMIELVYEDVDPDALQKAEEGDMQWHMVARTGKNVYDFWVKPFGWMDDE